MTSEKSGSRLEAVLKSEKPVAGKETAEHSDLTSALERELGAEDTELAKELQRTRAEEIIARRRIAIDRMRGGQAPAQDNGGAKFQERGKEWLTDMAQGLLERGLDPGVVGRTVDYLIGAGQIPQVGLPGGGTPAQGMSFADVKSLFEMGQNANKVDPTLATILEKLTAKIEAVEKLAATPRSQPERRSAFIIKADNSVEEVSLDRPILLEPKSSVEGGEPIEVVKEKNRHAEEMERLKTDKEHKNKLSETLASIPEKIGRGLAGQVLDEEDSEPETGAVAKTEGQEPFKCPDCGSEFMIPVESTRITCPYCTQEDGSPTVFTREKKV